MRHANGLLKQYGQSHLASGCKNQEHVAEVYSIHVHVHLHVVLALTKLTDRFISDVPAKFPCAFCDTALRSSCKRSLLLRSHAEMLVTLSRICDKISIIYVCRNEDIPSVVAVGSTTKTVKRSSSTILQVVSTPPACGKNILAFGLSCRPTRYTEVVQYYKRIQ